MQHLLYLFIRNLSNKTNLTQLIHFVKYINKICSTIEEFKNHDFTHLSLLTVFMTSINMSFISNTQFA